MKRTLQLIQENESSSVTPEELFKAICQDVCENVDTDLGSVWLFNPTGERIVCQCRYDALEGTYSSGQILEKRDYPTYFQHIVEENIVSAPNAHQQHATREFTESYFKPLGIVSLLDFILHVNFKPVGIICCENRREIRNWSKEDEIYLLKIASYASMRFKLSYEGQQDQPDQPSEKPL